MTPDSIILLTPEARLDALLYALEGARTRAMALGCHEHTQEAWDAYTAAWEALHAELMAQVDQSPKDSMNPADKEHRKCEQ